MMSDRKTFNQKLNRLEEIVGLLERPDVELEDGLALLEEGVALHKECQQMLTKTQAKIATLLSAEAIDGETPPSETPGQEADTIDVGLFSSTEPENSENSSEEPLPF